MLFACLLALQSQGLAQTGGTTLPQIPRGTAGQAALSNTVTQHYSNVLYIYPEAYLCELYRVNANDQAIETKSLQTLVMGPDGLYYYSNTLFFASPDSWKINRGGGVIVPPTANPGRYRCDLSALRDVVFAAGKYSYDIDFQTFRFEVPGSATPTPTPPTPTPPTPTPTAPTPTATQPPPTGTSTQIPPPPPPPPPTGTSTATPIPTATATNTPIPTATATNTPIPTATPIVTPSPTATPTATPTPPNSVSWSPASQVGEIVDATTGAITGYNGRMTAPQDQTASTPSPDDIVVAAGDTLPCAVEIATDNDKRTETLNGVSTTTYPADGVTYKWTAEDSSGVPSGSFDADSSSSATWTAPPDAGDYTLKCSLDDPWTGTQTGVPPNEGDRNDKATTGGAPVVRSVQVTVYRVTNVTAQGAERVQEHVGSEDIWHFATAKGTIISLVTLTATVQPDTPAVREHIDWEGASEDVNNPLKATLPKSAASKNIVKIKDSATARVLKEMRVWVIWCDIVGTRIQDATVEPGYFAYTTAPPPNGASGTSVRARYEFTATVNPPALITDLDRPDFSVPPVSLVSNSGARHTLDNRVFGQPTMKWDFSRAWRIKALSPFLGTNDYPIVNGSIFSGLPSSSKIIATTPAAADDGYPSTDTEGNDDGGSGTGQPGDFEDDDPYTTPNIGKLTDMDRPVIPGVMDASGAIGDSLEWRLQFRSFVRLEIGNQWYRVSDYFYWKLHSKLKKASEATDNTDYNSDGDKTDTLWINNSSVADATNSGF